ncbi:DUF1801 domain-containing protein [Flavobacterium sp. MFBS3-15]|uniref:DUF1801 domain-containing protein n=1 Tax=Flavobacterium sp. MFBS3-15 TaxID=2989816 RepID=UPI002236BEC8|nr:DUF1801 domain-containing protein [Flavobacterium sp. MFBS3-15]MCW4467704.1 DUF1801 domain-containing protein [Flavobacterium sp. MFBS3-15]
MAEIKTKASEANVEEFINSFADTEQKKQDSFELIKIMQEHTGHPAKMWGPSIVGFGRYDYKYDSGHGGAMPIAGFSPRKSAISLYVFTGLQEHEHLLEGLGKFKMGKACIYVKKLSNIDINQLKKLMDASIAYLREKYAVND